MYSETAPSATESAASVPDEDTIPTTIVAAHVKHVSHVKAILERHMPSYVAWFVLCYLGSRCTLCDEGVGVLVKDGNGTFQWWCITCSKNLLPDDTWVSPCHGPRPHSYCSKPGRS